MKLTYLAVENFLSFKEKTALDPIKNVTVFVGPNNAGKSNLIKTFKFLRGYSRGAWEIDINQLLFDKKGKEVIIEFKVELSEDERRNLVNSDRDLAKIFETVDFSKNPIFKSLHYFAAIDGRGSINESLNVTDENGHDTTILERKLQANKIQALATDLGDKIKANGNPAISNIDLVDKGFVAFAAGIFANGSGAFEYKFVSHITKNLQKMKIYEAHRRADAKVAGGEQTELNETGNNLIGVLNTIQGVKSTEFVRIMDIYRGVIGGVESVNLPPVGNQYTVKLDEDGLDSQTEFSNISTGLHQLMILVVALEQGKEDQIILIEEPEIHLHSSSQKRLFRLITKKSKKNQFVIATHSPVFTDVNENTSTFLITRLKGISRINVIEKKEDLRFIRQQLGIRNSDVFGDDYTIFVEGESEEIAFPIISKVIGFEKFGKEVNLINLKGDSKFLKLELFLEYLKNQDTGVFLIADGGSKIANKIDDFVKRGLVSKNNTRVWEKEFEDTFDNDHIISAMTALSGKKGFEFKMTPEELDKGRKSNQKVAKIINKHLIDKEQPELVKTDLAEELAQQIAIEIQKGEQREETLFENEVKNIMKITNSTEEESLLEGFDATKIDKNKAFEMFKHLKSFFDQSDETK